MEYAIGTRISLEVVESNGKTCEGCFFRYRVCTEMCHEYSRTDRKDIVFKEIKEE